MGKYRLDQVMLAAILLQVALSPLTADAQSTQNDLGSAIALQDADIDAISDVPTLRRLLKRYSGLVRSGAGIQEQQAARQREEFALQTRALEAQALSYGNFALYLMDVNSGNESAAEKLSEAQEECRNLSTLQSAVNGGLALGPAAYGRTYLSVFGFLTPFLFKNCSTNSGFKPTKIKEETLDSIRSTIKTMQRDYSAQDGH